MESRSLYHKKNTAVPYKKNRLEDRERFRKKELRHGWNAGIESPRLSI